MKKVFFAIGAFAAAALAFSSCQKQETSVPESEMITVTLTAEKAGVDTKTAAVESESSVSYIWTQEDKENFRLFTVTTGSDGSDSFSVVDNPDVSISDDGKILTVTATVTKTSTLRAVVSGQWTSSNKPKVNANQSPLTDNFDPNADILVSDDVIVDGLEEELLTFRRPVAISKMTLKNMIKGEKVNEITISSETDLTGYYDKGSMTGQLKSITLSYDDVEVGKGGEFPVYFVTMPNQDHTLTVVVKTDQNNYTKTFGPLSFVVGKFAKFGVGLPEGSPVVDTDYTGDWVITGVNGEDAFAAQAFVSGKNNLTALGVTLDVENEKIASSNVDGIKMHLEKVTTGDYEGLYTIMDASGNYLYAASSSSNYLRGAATIGGVDYYWAVEKELDGVFSIKATESSNRNVMQFNSTSSLFSCYASASQKPVTLYPASWVVKAEEEEIVNESTLDNPYTPAEANALALRLGTKTLDDVYVAGIVSEVSVSTEYGNADYYISADGTDTDAFFVYRGKYIDGEAFTSTDQLKVGDKVTVLGTLKLYNNTPEFNSGSSIVKYESAGPAQNYTITVNSSENGTVTASATEATAGTVITLSVTPATGYVLEDLTVLDASNNSVTVSSFKFTMPESNVTVSATFKEDDPSASYYVKVTSAADLTDGEYLIVYEEGSLAMNGGLTDKLDAVGNSISVVIDNNRIAVSDAVDAAAFTYDATAKTLKGAGGLYMGQTSDANGLASSATTTYENTISIVEGNANIVSGGAYLRYNSASNQTRFRYYKSSSYTGQKAVALYKK